MSSLTIIHGEFDQPRFACENNNGAVVLWIRTKDDSVSLRLTPDQREALRAALDELEAA